MSYSQHSIYARLPPKWPSAASAHAMTTLMDGH